MLADSPVFAGSFADPFAASFPDFFAQSFLESYRDARMPSRRARAVSHGYPAQMERAL